MPEGFPKRSAEKGSAEDAGGPPQWVKELGIREGEFDAVAFYEDALSNPSTRLLVERATLDYLKSDEMREFHQFVYGTYSGNISSGGYLIDTQGMTTKYTPSSFILEGDPKHLAAIAEEVRKEVEAKYGSESAVNALSTERGVNPEYAGAAAAASEKSRERLRWLVRRKPREAGQQEQAAEQPAGEEPDDVLSIDAVPEMGAVDDMPKQPLGQTDDLASVMVGSGSMPVAAPEAALDLTQDMEVADEPETDPASGPDPAVLAEDIVRAKEQIPEYKAAMQAAEAAYLEAYKDFYCQKGAKEGEEPEELLALKQAYNDSRITYGNALTKMTRDRLLMRPAPPPSKDGRSSEEQRMRTLERYNRLVRFNEVVKPASRALYQARAEALGERPKNIFQKGLAWAGKQNQRLEEWAGSKAKARVARSAIAALAVTGGAAAVGSFATAGVLAAGGYAGFRFGKSLLGAFAGAAAGESAALIYARLYGEKALEKSQKELALEGRSQDQRTSKGMMLSADELDQIDISRVALEKKSDRMGLEKRKNLVRALTALGVGAGASALLADWASVDSPSAEAATQPVSPDKQSSVPTERTAKPDAAATEAKEAPAVERAAPSADSAKTQQTEASKAVPAEKAAAAPAEKTAPEPASKSVDKVAVPAPASIAGPAENLEAGYVSQPVVTAMIGPEDAGMGSNALLLELKSQAAGVWEMDTEQRPVVRMLMEKDVDSISRLMDDYGSRGMVMQPGDRFFLDDKQELYFQREGQPPQLFLENVPGSDEVKVHPLNGQELAPAPVIPAPTESPAPVQPEASQETPAEAPALTAPESISEETAQNADVVPAERPAETSTESASANVTEFGADLSKPAVYADSNGNLFAHVPADPSKSMEQMNDMRAALAQEYAKANPGTPVSAISEVRKDGWFSSKTETSVLTFISPVGAGPEGIALGDAVSSPAVPDMKSFRPASS